MGSTWSNADASSVPEKASLTVRSFGGRAGISGNPNPGAASSLGLGLCHRGPGLILGLADCVRPSDCHLPCQAKPALILRIQGVPQAPWLLWP